MTRYSIRDEYAPRFGREVLTLSHGSFSSAYAGEAWQLPKRDGYMVTLDAGYLGTPRKVRVECESPRTDENYERVDAAINAAITLDRVAQVRERLERDGLDPDAYHCLGIVRTLEAGDYSWQSALGLNRYLSAGVTA